MCCVFLRALDVMSLETDDYTWRTSLHENYALFYTAYMVEGTCARNLEL